jgi:hypothetical protein
MRMRSGRQSAQPDLGAAKIQVFDSAAESGAGLVGASRFTGDERG